MSPASARSIAVLLLLLVAAGLGGCPARSAATPAKAVPVTDQAWADNFRNVFRSGRIYFAGAPTEEGLRTAAASGVNNVVDMLPAAEHPEKVPFDEPALVDQLGIRYVRLPVTAASFSAADVERFSKIMAQLQTDDVLLIHCASSNRVGGLWAAYLRSHHKLSMEEALAHGRAAGLSGDSMVAAVRRVAE